jgi:hypothetical protein
MTRTFQNVRNSFPDTIRDFRSPLVLISVKGPHHPVLIGFPTLVARTYTVCRSMTSFRARGQFQGPWTTPLDPHLPSCSTWWSEPCCRLARIHWSPVAGPCTGPRADSFNDTLDFSGKGAVLPSLPRSTALSRAPSGSSPRLSATRATPSRAPIWRAARCHGHESVTPAE